MSTYVKKQNKKNPDVFKYRLWLSWFYFDVALAMKKMFNIE